MIKTLTLFLLFFTSAIGFSQDFTVDSCSVDIYINQKGYFDVVENYNLNFEAQKHGIFRTIITEYDLLTYDQKKEKRKIRISAIEVPNYNFEKPFDFEQRLSKSLEIKIGDKDKFVIGPQKYQIKYRVHNAFLFEENQIRFYWNIKPDGWAASFQNINFKIHIPKGITVNADSYYVYSGYTGTTEKSDEFVLSYENNIISGTSKDGFQSNPGESVTILLNLPENSIAEIKPLWPFWTNYGWSFIILGLIAGFYSVWKKYGKDDDVVSTTSYYPPDNIDPPMAGYLINDRNDTSDIISLLPYWGAKGFLKIEEIPKGGLFSKADTKLIKLKPLPSSASPYEHEIFDGLFGGSLQLSSKGKAKSFLNDIFGVESIKLNPNEILVSSLKETFYTTMASAGSMLKENAQLYYEAESKKIRTITYILLFLGGIVLGIVGLLFWGPIAAICIVITCIILILFNTYMIKKNKKGNKVFSELKGFKQFIKIAEENKLKMLLNDDPGYFETTMAYALAFGMFKKWANKFDDLNMEPPSWYSSATGNYISMNSFSKSFSNVMSNTSSTMVSSPSSNSGGSSGGGSSGGGFGGGGGGSW
ncbi:DUF2207 domain-containing protein [Aureibaculum sp. A20]|uniref:DUF2207 domain-containing protein n=1 Tax=Aureibaculum flavum TaxID=2795986 RepID=A0ABS0WTJ4_9FLAO|nr:DUF2207 domain-containing protein [Aureibaculum flavum]MBJ2175304.1 DUF2207 domain-containing protein [Aureibaculum flavum]